MIILKKLMGILSSKPDTTTCNDSPIFDSNVYEPNKRPTFVKDTCEFFCKHNDFFNTFHYRLRLNTLQKTFVLWKAEIVTTLPNVNYHSI